MQNEVNRNFKWFNCVNRDCGKHLAKIIQPSGLIEIKNGHGKSKKFEIAIYGSVNYTCPHCNTKNIIGFVHRPSHFRPVNENGQAYQKKLENKN